jgi:hypothetical protein
MNFHKRNTSIYQDPVFKNLRERESDERKKEKEQKEEKGREREKRKRTFTLELFDLYLSGWVVGT